MKIDKSKLKLGIWYTDDNLKYIQSDCSTDCQPVDPPEGATLVHTCFPLSITTNTYKLKDKSGRYGTKDLICSSETTLCTADDKLILAMVNSGEYTLSETLVILANACERCLNALWDKYFHGEEGYPEYSKEWYETNTVCDFCRNVYDSDHTESSNVKWGVRILAGKRASTKPIDDYMTDEEERTICKS